MNWKVSLGSLSVLMFFGAMLTGLIVESYHGSRRAQYYPAMAPEVMRVEFVSLRSEIDQIKPGARLAPAKYFELLGRTQKLIWATERLEYDGKTCEIPSEMKSNRKSFGDRRLPQAPTSIMVTALRQTVTNSMPSTQGSDTKELERSRNEFERLPESHDVPPGLPQEDTSWVWWLFVYVYLFTCVPAGMQMHDRVADDGRKPVSLAALCFGSLYMPAVVVWPAGLLWFKADPRVVIRRALECAMYVVTLGVSLAGGGVVKVFGQSADTSKTTGKKRAAWVVSGDVEVVSSYMGLDIDEFGGKSLQGSIAVTNGSLTLGSWVNEPLDNKGSREYDFFANHYRKLLRGSLTLGATYIMAGKLSSRRDDVLTLSVGFTTPQFARRGLSVSAHVKHMAFIAMGKAVSGGNLTEVGADLGLKLRKGVTVTFSPNVRVDDGAFGYQPGVLYDTTIEIRRRLSEHVSVFANVRFGAMLTHVTDGRHPRVASSGGLAFNFF